MLLKPASGLCGLRCRYCFYHDETAKRERASYGIMEEAVLEAVIQRALASATQSCTFSFQGGEPTLAGRTFFPAGGGAGPPVQQKAGYRCASPCRPTAWT